VVAGTQAAVLMVESEAMELSEEVMLGAVVFGHQQMQTAIDAINELADEAGKPEWDWAPAARNEAVHGKVNQLVEAELQEAYRITSKQLRSQRIKEITAYAVEAMTADDDAPDASAVRKMVDDVEARIVRGRILAGEPRIDGRDTRTVRPIAIRSGVLPRAHGSALFTRGRDAGHCRRHTWYRA
jgi:polyribonucleotide nucleotidyltransferase